MGCSQVWVLRLQEAFPLQMNDFDRLLELELARMLDSVVRTPAPPRSSPPGRRPVVRLFTASGSSIGPVATVVVLADGPAEQRAEVAFPEPASTPVPAIFS
jgi:hypothetical protein